MYSLLLDSSVIPVIQNQQCIHIPVYLCNIVPDGYHSVKWYITQGLQQLKTILPLVKLNITLQQLAHLLCICGPSSSNPG